MLGRVFEGVMDPDERRVSGSFYTPAALVRELVRAGLEAALVGRFGLARDAAERWIHDGQPPLPPRLPDLRRLKVVDPAVGSGAFLLGALEELVALRRAAGEGPLVRLKRDVLACSLFGVRSEEHTSELQSPCNLVCRLLLEKKKKRALHTQVEYPKHEHCRQRRDR